MNKLTCLDGAKRPAHPYRVLNGKVLVTNDAGDCAWDAGEELRDSPEAELKTSLLAWTGPAKHLLFLERKGRMMSLDMVRETIDLIFSAPGPRLNLELAGAADQSRVWFAVQYARRKGEWTGRAVKITLRLDGGKSDLLKDHGLSLKALADLKGAPKALPRARKAALWVPPEARRPGGWVREFEKAGYEWVLLSPESMTEAGVSRFLKFYAQALDAMLDGPVREERAAGFLSRGRWNLPGHDVLAELAYAPGGGIYSSEEGLSLAEDGNPAFCLGTTSDTRFADLARREAVRAVFAATHGDNQPLCFQCVYKPFCSLPPSLNFRRQGTIWGQTPSSLQCTLHMGILDLIFERLKDEKRRNILQKWAIDIDRQTV